MVIVFVSCKYQIIDHFHFYFGEFHQCQKCHCDMTAHKALKIFCHK